MIRTGEDSFEDECHDHYDNVFGRRSWVIRDTLNLEEIQTLAAESKEWVKENER